jgi:hypothetical protein
MYNNIQVYMNLFQNQSPIGKTSKITFYSIYPSSPPNTHLVEAPQVPQLSTKSGLENINRLEYIFVRKKNRVPFSP